MWTVWICFLMTAAASNPFFPGISMSINITSGCTRRALSTASFPSDAASISAASPKIPLSREISAPRLLGSSSATSTLNMQFLPYNQSYTGPQTGTAEYIHFAAAEFHPFPNIIQSYRVMRGGSAALLRTETAAVVSDHNRNSPTPPERADTHQSTAFLQPVNDCVFHQRLEDKFRNGNIRKRRISMDFHSNAVAVSCLLQFHIIPQKPDFPPQCNDLLIAFQRIPEKIRQTQNQIL